MKKLLLIISALLVILIAILLFNTFTLKSKQLAHGAGSELQLPVDKKAVQHLSQAIQINTVSYYEKAKMDSAQPGFDSLIQLLKTSYPLVFSTLKDTVINNRNLLLKWEGTKDYLPAILYAHMDVVPVEQSTLAQWKHAPFSGEIADDYIWGRGALDDKGSLISILEAINRCLQNGLKPERTIYIASGSDEELGGNTGAESIAQYCRDNKLHFAFYLDEGLMVTHGVVPGMEKDVALIGTAEKGYATIELTVDMPGGHSSKPQKETALDVLVNTVKKVHDRPFEKMFSPATEQFIDYLGPEMNMPLKMVFANQWLLKGVILNEYAKTDAGNALVRTTGVTTVMNAGFKDNVIPTHVNAKINFRILPGQTVADVVKHVKEVVNDNRVQVILDEHSEPSSTTPANSWGFKALQKTAAEVFPDAVVAPSLMIGATDSKHFQNLTETTYRFFPTRMDNEAIGTLHGINERIKISNYMETIKFYEVLFNNMQTFTDESRK